MKRCTVVFLLLASVYISGCSLAPGYVRPDAGLPATAPPGWDQSVADLNTEWWQGFGSSTLPYLQARGRSGNYDFAASGWNLAQAMARVRVSRSALFPWINAEGGATRTGAYTTDRSQYNKVDVVSGAFQVSYELDVWGKIRSETDGAAFLAEAGLNDWRAAGLSLESTIALSYFHLLSVRERLRVQTDVLEASRKTLRFIETQLASGASSRLDMVRQRSAVSSMEAGVTQLHQAYKSAENDLNSLLGTATMPPELVGSIVREKITALNTPTVPSGLPSGLLTRRPDILSAEGVLQSANANVGVARAAFLPSISLTARGGWQSDDLSSLFTPQSALFSLVSNLLAPIFQGGRLVAQHDIAVARQKEMAAKYQQTVLNAFLEVDTAIATTAFLTEEESRRSIAVKDAREAYRILRIQYAEGAEDLLAVLDAQRTLLQTEDALITVTQARLNASVALFKALGGGWDSRYPETGAAS